MAAQESISNIIYALINYKDPYVQPLLLSALANRLPASSYQLIPSLSELPSPDCRLLQWTQYESIDFDHLVSHPTSSLANAYVIRKALIRKHYLSTTTANWVTKHPGSVLARGVKPSVEFEVDYAEFLDDALVEAWELKASWQRNAGLEGEGKEKSREWWILKPGMSERGQGIRLFSSEEELTDIFGEWDPESDDEEEEEGEGEVRSDAGSTLSKGNTEEKEGKGIITSQLRHFIAQPYIHPPLLLSPPSSQSSALPSPATASRKFHIRTYILATGALKIHVYRPMLALFAARDYQAPWDQALQSDRDEAMKAHLTNTCLQDSGDREGSVALFWNLPDELPLQPDLTSSAGPAPPPYKLSHDSAADGTWKLGVFDDICKIAGETFEAAARGMGIHFQPLPNAFEIFGLDFMVGVQPDGELRTWLMEVNAFPDFRQTGDQLSGMIGRLFEGVVDVAVAPFCDVSGGEEGVVRDLVEVLDIDLGRR